ncbi:type I iodothyronine deiodinase-like [Penaeus japonicus]|uniref:type I iodothyronine deiodinase-like n=1 Tax=Penaeus japonicus TaxID=27405 RepID=UPI001C70EE96|nr:type I iodothyronine deiodinase-like [Penaeus japonicus]
MADAWVVARYIFLPFKLVRAVLFNISLTIAVNLFPETFFKFFFKEQDKNDLNKYMAPVARNVGNLSYIWQRMKMHWLCAVRETTMIAEQGSPAPNPALVRLSDGSECRLLDLAKAGRPLVINFGSCT